MQPRTEVVILVLLSAFGLLGAIFGLWGWGASRGRPDLAGAQMFAIRSPDGSAKIELRDAAGWILLSFGAAEITAIDEEGRNLGSLLTVSEKDQRFRQALERSKEALFNAQDAMNHGNLDLAKRLLDQSNADLLESQRALGK